MLVNRLKPRPFHSFPDFLLQRDRTPTYCPRNMAKVFGDFYHKLYNCLTPANNFTFNQEAFDAFFTTLKLPKLSPTNRQLINEAISPEELMQVLKHLLTHKSPGSDGFPYSYYKSFSHILTPHMIALYNSSQRPDP